MSSSYPPRIVSTTKAEETERGRRKSMLVEPKNLFYYHVFHWVEAAIVGQALLWLDPKDHPVLLVLPLDHLHVLPIPHISHFFYTGRIF